MLKGEVVIAAVGFLTARFPEILPDYRDQTVRER